jgi:hypothetical protein
MSSHPSRDCVRARAKRRLLCSIAAVTVAAIPLVSPATPAGAATLSFAPAVQVHVGEVPRSVIAGDFNGDGKVDLAAANQAPSTVSVLLGDGAGGFAHGVSFAVAVHPLSVTVGDFNGDGNADIATASLAAGSVSVLFGDGAGHFAPAIDFTADSPRSVTAGDVNRDGRTDLVVANGGNGQETSTVSVLLLADGAGGFGSALKFPVGRLPVSVGVGTLTEIQILTWPW